MKRATLSPLSSRRLRTLSRSSVSCGAGFAHAAPARPKASQRTLATGRTTRHAYFNAFCALVTPAR